MLQVSCIGHLGSDASVKSANGKEFTTFRIAHSERWTDDSGQAHDSTTWVDCIISGKASTLEYLKRGQLVYVSGSCSLRCYSSAKDRCMKAGMTINVRSVELLGGKTDDVPSQLTNLTDGKIYNVYKYFHIPEFAAEDAPLNAVRLQSKSGASFAIEQGGWVKRLEDATE